MFGIGVMAACIVLFVPMGMAGWHLSRNKMLFFSGALFISLAVFVHLTPFFPSSISNFFSISSNKLPLLVFDNRESCISFLHHIVFHVKPPPPPPPPPPLSDTPLPLINTTNSNHYHSEVEISWDWSANSTPVLACDFQKLGDSDASDLLNGSWIVVAGDSQARFIALSLLNLVLNSQDMGSVKADLFKRHTNYQIVISDIGMKFDFIWAPFVTNLTQLIMDFKQNRSYPDVLVMGSGLWHMLHITNESDYGASLQLMRNSMVSLVPASPEFGTDGPLSGSVSVQSPHLFWLGMPMLVNSMLNTVEKREKMSNAAYNAYDRELYKSKVLRQSGGPLLLLDMQSLSRSCGAHCTVDGIHYDEAVYEAAVHIMLNALLIESHQKL